MNFEDLIPIIGIISGTLLTGYIFAKVFGLIKYWIDHKHHDSEDIEILLHQFNTYKRSVEERLQHLEMIVTDTPDLDINPEAPLQAPDALGPIDEKQEEEEDAERRRLQNMLKKTH